MTSDTLSELLKYLAFEKKDYDRIPSLSTLSHQLGVSISCLREQLEVARILEIVEIKPKAGIRRIPYKFQPTLRTSLNYAASIDERTFDNIADLRAKLEGAYWFQAVSQLQPEEKTQLLLLVNRAEEKIKHNPPINPYQEHREFHLTIFKNVDNFILIGIFGFYWEMYEKFGLNTILDSNYLEKVWGYHRRIAEAIELGDYDQSFDLMQEHLKLIQKRTQPIQRQRFE